MGPKGMTLNVSLRDINIAMPRTLADMNTFEQTSLYLIKASCLRLCGLLILLQSTGDDLLLSHPYCCSIILSYHYANALTNACIDSPSISAWQCRLWTRRRPT